MTSCLIDYPDLESLFKGQLIPVISKFKLFIRFLLVSLHVTLAPIFCGAD